MMPWTSVDYRIDLCNILPTRKMPSFASSGNAGILAVFYQNILQTASQI